jgi:lipopolysaccharide transport protein LptA
MTTSLRKQVAAAAVLFLLSLTSIASAQDADLNLRLPWTIDSETMSFDGKTSTVIYTGLRFSQGSIFIEADEGRSTVNEQDAGSWVFTGNVIIDVNQGRIESQTATLTFNGNLLTKAVVTGAPATFQMQRPGADDATHAVAGQLVYDVQNGVIEFSGEATITESGNEISSNYLVYNINERRINADSSGADDDRVRIIYTPTETNGDSASDDAESTENQ